MNVGIISYGVYIPKYRIKVSDIASVWGKDGDDIERSLKITEKSVASFDEDAATQAFEAGGAALKEAKLNPSQIEACFVGSESRPYAVNPTSTIVAELLNVGNKYFASDFQFACKAGTSAMLNIAGLISSGFINYGLAIGTDSAQAKPHDILEYTAAAGSAAFILGKEDKNLIAKLINYSSFTSDTSDFWRRDGQRFPSHGGRFTGEPAYFSHVISAARLLLEKTGMKPKDFEFCVFHMPNGKFPKDVATRLGFTDQQLAPSLIVDYIGNPYSASSLLGLCAVLDKARKGQYIFMVSYGSGAGSDGLIFKTTKNIKRKRKTSAFLEQVNNKKYISYVDYLKNTKKI